MTAKTKTGRWKLWLIGGVAAFIALIVIVGVASNGTVPAETPAAEPAETTAPVETVEEAPVETEAAPEAPASDLATDVQAALLAANGVDSFQALEATSPGFWIASIETLNTSTVRVNFQTELTDEERGQYGDWVLNMACGTTTDLSTVVVRDTSGIDSNRFLSDSPRPNACA